MRRTHQWQTATVAVHTGQAGTSRPQGDPDAHTSMTPRVALEEALAALEGGAWALAFPSGLAATQALGSLLAPGDHVLLSDDAYGGTHRLFTRVLARYGIEVSQVDLTDSAALAGALRPATRLVWAETPTNPNLKLVDIARIAEVLADHPARLVVDNTFATPALQRPLALGADLVLHSTTKYLAGHDDAVGGAVVGNDPDLLQALQSYQAVTGVVPGTLDSWLVLRGLQTLASRMDRHCANAQGVAEFLAGHAAVEQVSYPGLPSHPGHLIAARQMRGYGGMVSFTVRGGADTAAAVVGATRLFALAESLGGVGSLIELPGAMTHAGASSVGGVPPHLVRLSVGLEAVDDLRADLAQALAVADI